MSDSKSNILIIDDEPETVDQLASLIEGAAVRVLGPSEVTLDTLQQADLVLVDFALGNWPDRESCATFGLRPEDGLALTETFRSALRAKEIAKPIAFAVLTGELDTLTKPFPADPREHMVARSVNLEWAFQKKTSSKRLSAQFNQLASAIRELPESWPYDSSADKDQLLFSLLRLTDDESWVESARADLIKCHPPVRELSTWTHGLAFIRWLLHRILPYPCFLLDTHYVAARLRLTHDSFLKSLAAEEPLSKAIAPARYTGVLPSFLGARWWRAGLDDVIWHLTPDDPFSTEVLKSKVRELSPSGQLLEGANPVVCVDSDYHSTDTVADAADCVRLLPDDWPLFAEKAWALRSAVVEDDRLRMVVSEEDRPLLEERA